MVAVGGFRAIFLFLTGQFSAGLIDLLLCQGSDLLILGRGAFRCQCGAADLLRFFYCCFGIARDRACSDADFSIDRILNAIGAGFILIPGGACILSPNGSMGLFMAAHVGVALLQVRDLLLLLWRQAIRAFLILGGGIFGFILRWRGLFRLF